MRPLSHFSENFPASSDSDIFGQHVLPLPVPDSPFLAFFDLGSSTPSDSSMFHYVEPDLVDSSPPVLSNDDSSVITPVEPVNRAKRQTKVPAYLDQYHCYLLQNSPFPFHSSHTTSYPIYAFLS